MAGMDAPSAEGGGSRLAGGQLRGMRRGAGARRGPCPAAAGCREARGEAKGGPRGAALGLLRCLLAAALSGALLASILGASASASIYGTGARGPIALAETPKAPKVTKQPTNKTVEEGQSVTFESTASGTPTPTEQWERSTNGGSTWSPIEGATSSQLTIAST